MLSWGIHACLCWTRDLLAHMRTDISEDQCVWSSPRMGEL